MGCQQSHLRKMQHPQPSHPTPHSKSINWKQQVPNVDAVIFIPVHREKTMKVLPPPMDKIEEVDLDKEKTEKSSSFVQSVSEPEVSFSNRADIVSIPTRFQFRQQRQQQKAQYKGSSKKTLQSNRSIREIPPLQQENPTKRINNRVSLTQRKMNVIVGNDTDDRNDGKLEKFDTVKKGNTSSQQVYGKLKKEKSRSVEQQKENFIKEQHFCQIDVPPKEVEVPQ